MCFKVPEEANATNLESNRQTVALYDRLKLMHALNFGNAMLAAVHPPLYTARPLLNRSEQTAALFNLYRVGTLAIPGRFISHLHGVLMHAWISYRM